MTSAQGALLQSCGPHAVLATKAPEESDKGKQCSVEVTHSRKASVDGAGKRECRAIIEID